MNAKELKKLGESSGWTRTDVGKATVGVIVGAALLVKVACLVRDASRLLASPSTNLENPTIEQSHRQSRTQISASPSTKLENPTIEQSHRQSRTQISASPSTKLENHTMNNHIDNQGPQI